jgi:anti-sigma-K factor RskA
VSNGEHIRLEDLELHALGTLPDDEAAALRAHVAGCADCATNLAQAHGDAAMLAFAVKQARPAATVKAELMARIRANREAEERYAWPSRITGAEGERVKTGAESEVKSSWWNWVLVPAAVALALVSFGLSWQNRRIAAELQREHRAAETFVHDREQIEKLVNMLAAPDTITVKLAGTGDAADASGVVKYNGKMGVMVYSADLPPLPADKSYQLWLLPPKGSPIGGGLIGPGGHAWGNLWTADAPVNTEAKAFVVTIEPVGGMAQPTGPKVLSGTTQ